MRSRFCFLFLLAVLACQGCRRTEPSPTSETVGAGGASANQELAQEVPGNVPSDREAYEYLMRREFRSIHAALRANPAEGEARLAEFKTRFPSLRPQSQQAKEVYELAQSSIERLERLVARSRLALPDLEAKLRANPDNLDVIAMYQEKAADVILAQAFSDPDAARKTCDRVQAVLQECKVKPALQTIERPEPSTWKPSFMPPQTWFLSPQNTVQRRRPRVLWDLEAHALLYPDDIVALREVVEQVTFRIDKLSMSVMQPLGPDTLLHPRGRTGESTSRTGGFTGRTGESTAKTQVMQPPGPDTPPHPRQQEIEAEFGQLKTFLQSLQPITDQGKAYQKEALAEEVRREQPWVERRLGDLSLADLESRVKANPDDPGVLAVYVLKARRDIVMAWTVDASSGKPKVVPDRPEIEKRRARLKALLEKIQPISAETRKEKEVALGNIAFSEEHAEIAKLSKAELESRLRADPNDVRSLRRYLSKISDEIHRESAAGKYAAVAQKFAEQRKVLASVRPTTEPARAEKARIEESIGPFERSIEQQRISKLSRPELEDWLKGHPNDDHAWGCYKFRVQRDIAQQMYRNKREARRVVNEVQAILRSVKPDSKEALNHVAEVQKVIARYEEQSKSERRISSKVIDMWEADIRIRLNPEDVSALEDSLEGHRRMIEAHLKDRQAARAETAIGRLKTRLEALQKSPDSRVLSLLEEVRPEIAKLQERLILLRANPKELAAWITAHPEDREARCLALERAPYEEWKAWFTAHPEDGEILVLVLERASPADLGAWLRENPDHGVALKIVQKFFFGRKEIADLKALYEALGPGTNRNVQSWRNQLRGQIVAQELQNSQATLSELAAELQVHPGDDLALAKYLQKVQVGIVTNIQKDNIKGAEKIRDEALALLDSLRPATEEARTQVGQARKGIEEAIKRIRDVIAWNKDLKPKAQDQIPKLEAKLQANPNDLVALEQYQNWVILEVLQKIETDPAAAEKLHVACTDFLKGVQAKAGAQAHGRIASFLDGPNFREVGRMAGDLARRIGQPAGSLNIDAWLNGPPLADADLRGKVILLDYWRMGAKGSSPLVSSWGLRAWSDRYADRGLVIISLVSYCRYVASLTGPEGQRARKVEQEMLREWAKDSGLTQRLAVQKLEQGVAMPIGGTGFEHVVVIDREGKVRLIVLERIQAVDDLLEKLLGRPE